MFSQLLAENNSRAIAYSVNDSSNTRSTFLFSHSPDTCRRNFLDSALSCIPSNKPPVLKSEYQNSLRLKPDASKFTKLKNYTLHTIHNYLTNLFVYPADKLLYLAESDVTHVGNSEGQVF
jgi:hypothetical protein